VVNIGQTKSVKGHKKAKGVSNGKEPRREGKENLTDTYASDGDFPLTHYLRKKRSIAKEPLTAERKPPMALKSVREGLG